MKKREMTNTIKAENEILTGVESDLVELGQAVFAGHGAHVVPLQYPVVQSVAVIHSTQMPDAALHTAALPEHTVGLPCCVH